MSTKKKAPPSKKHILIEANDLIHGQRRKEYGAPITGLRKVAEQWTLYLTQRYGYEVPEITPEDVCWMMADVRKTRQTTAPKRENVLDAAGYIGLIDEAV